MRRLLPFVRSRDERQEENSHRTLARVATGLTLAIVWVSCTALAKAETTTRVLPSGDGIEISGETYKETIPLYRSGGTQYFSAGVGLEERDAKYPPFPLKLIFVEGARAYLTTVAVTITNDAGTVRLDIPEEHVNGPWLFVDLPQGTYTINASREGETREKARVVVTPGRVRIVYLRWP